MKKLRGLTYLLGNNFGRWLHRWRNLPIVSGFNKFLVSIRRGYTNYDNFDAEQNGEYALLKRLTGLELKTFFDVGANQGDWSLKIREIFPESQIHCFEIADPTCDKLIKRLGDGFIINRFGLGDAEATVTLKYSKDLDVLTSAIDLFSQVPYSEIPGKIMKGDDYAQKNKVPFIDFLKIDVEGMEGHVLRGFCNLLTEHKVRLVQFEYGHISVTSHFLLKDFFDLFQKHGYQIGKIYSDYVEWFEYDFSREDFSGSNYIAVQKDDLAAIKVLTRS